jgi:hypothetical protein
MRHLNLGNSSEIIQLDFPLEWDPSVLTELTLTINDQANNELMAAAEASLYTSTTLENGVSRYDREIVLADESEDLEIGDCVRIVGVLGYEDHTVKGYDVDNLTAELEDYADRDFEVGAAVHRLSAVSTVDLSDTDTFPAGTELVLIWTPTGTGGPFTQTAKISSYQQIDIAGLSSELKDIYPRVYDGLTKPRNRLERVSASARRDIRSRLLIMDSNFDINLIRDQSILIPAVAAQCAVLWAVNGDDDMKEEREVYGLRVASEVDVLSKLSLWVDEDSDLVDDPLEDRTHPHIFHKGW